MKLVPICLLTILLGLLPHLAFAQDAAPAAPAKIDSGDTAWMLTSTALVLMMTIPGLALFYGWHGAQDERACDADAELCHLLPSRGALGVWSATASPSPTAAARSPPMSAICRGVMMKGSDMNGPFTLGAGTAAASADDDSRIGVHDVPDDVRDHHPGADYRRLRRAHEVFCPAMVHRVVVAAGLRTDCACGVASQWLPRRRRCTGFRRGHRGAHQCRHRRTGGGVGDR